MLCCLGLVGAAAGAGCSGPVQIDSADLAAADRTACEAMLDGLPSELAEEDERELEPPDALGAAYGDPAIVVTCVASAPEGFTDASACEEVNDVGWYVPESQARDADSSVTVTAMSHHPRVQVTIPADYRPDGAAAVLAEVSVSISTSLELVDECL